MILYIFYGNRPIDEIKKPKGDHPRLAIFESSGKWRSGVMKNSLVPYLHASKYDI